MRPRVVPRVPLVLFTSQLFFSDLTDMAVKGPVVDDIAKCVSESDGVLHHYGLRMRRMGPFLAGEVSCGASASPDCSESSLASGVR